MLQRCPLLLLTGRINPFPHTINLQQTTLNIFCQKMENLYNWMDNQWIKVENFVAKGEFAHREKLLLLPQCFQKWSAADASKCIYGWERVKQLLTACQSQVVFLVVLSSNTKLSKFWQKNPVICMLTLSHLQRHFNAIAADDFLP